MSTQLANWKEFFQALEKDILQVEEIITFLNTNVKSPCCGCYFSSQMKGDSAALYDLEEKLINTLVEDFTVDKYEEVIYLPVQHLYLKRVADYHKYDKEIYGLKPFYEVKKYTKTIAYYE